MRTIAVFNQKGGCGKTTTTINLAACLAEVGKRTLMVDLDPQAHTTIGTNVKLQDVECSIYHCLADREDGSKMLSLADIAWEILDNLFLAPSSIMLSAFEQRLAGAEGREERLLEALRRVEHIYDFTIIDCGPAMNLLSINAIRAADTILIPVETGFFCVESVDRVRETVDLVSRRTSHEPRVIVLATMYDPRTKSDRAAYRNLKSRYSDLMADTTVRFNAKLKEAAAAGSPITEYFPGCRGHRDFQALAHELMGTTIEVQLAQAEQETRAQMAEAQQAVEQLRQEVLGPQVAPDGIQFVLSTPGAKRVQLAGSFNNWNPEAGGMVPDEFNGHLWRLKLPVADGRYEYRFVIDGRWTSDPANQLAAPNEFGEFNSVVEVARQ
jgi:chromosome partitioning protein